MAPITPTERISPEGVQRILGPGQALDFHLSMFRRSVREASYFQGRAESEDGFFGADPREFYGFIRWVSFANTYSRPAMVYNAETGELEALDTDEVSISYLVDGRTNGEREVVMTQETVTKEVLTTALTMSRTEEVLLDEARTYYITTEMTELICEAAELAEPEPLFDSDLPSDSGLIVFETPLVMDDLHPDTGEPLGVPVMPVRAMGWRRTMVGKRDASGPTEGIVLINYTTSPDYDAIFVPRVNALGIEAAPGETAEDDVWPVEYHPWAFGAEWDQVDKMGLQGQGKIVSPVAYHRRWMLTLFRVMWQRIVHADHWQPTRQVRRGFDRSAKAKPTKLDGEGYSVLVLRRFQESTPESRGESSDWADWPHPYRIPVSPHWRRQHYPSLGSARLGDGSWNHESHRLVFIARHARGPEHLPIQERHSVTAVVR